MIDGSSVTAWRDRDTTIPGLTLDLPDITAGTAAETADRLYAAGARLIRLSGPVDVVDVAEAAALPTLQLVRELTRAGMVVDWQARLNPSGDDWQALSHLYPPSRLHGPPEALERWRAGFFPGRCILRWGPGFAQIRDWRWGWLRKHTLADPDQLALLTDLLRAPVATSGVPVATVVPLVELRVVQRIGDRLWLPAYRVQRWPVPAYLV